MDVRYETVKKHLGKILALIIILTATVGVFWVVGRNPIETSAGRPDTNTLASTTDIAPGEVLSVTPASPSVAGEANKPYTFKQVVKPKPEMSKEAYVVLKLLEDGHYARVPVDADISRKMAHNFLNSLDINHLIFLQSDVDNFQQASPTIRSSLLNQDISLAYDIFERFRLRVEQRSELIKRLLTEKYDFSQNETLNLDRSKEPWPKNEKEAEMLWRKFIKFQLLQEKLNKAKPEEAIKIVKRRLLERYIRSVNEMEAVDVLQAYLNSLARIYDPHTEYLPAETFNEFKISMKLSLVGIGALLTSEDGLTKIQSLTPGGPAEKDKRLKPNDKIVGVAQGDEEFVEVIDMKLKKVVSMIRGPIGTTVRIKVIPANAPDPSARSIVTIVRDEIKLTDQEAKAKLIELPDAKGNIRKIGVVDLPLFYTNTDMDKPGEKPKGPTEDIDKLIAELKKAGVEGVIIDLRRNGGGSLDEAISLTGLFIGLGPVVQVKDSSGGIKSYEDEDGRAQYNGPLVVLTSHMSASASEIFAAALQDYNRALIVGEQSTFGKGTVQAVIRLNNKYYPAAFPPSDIGALKMTVQKFYRIAGGSTQLKGVIPDVMVPSVFDYYDIAEKSLENPLPFDEIKAAKYTKYNDVSSKMIADLAGMSKTRVSTSKDFSYILEDIEIQKEKLKDKSLSLNEQQRVKEKEGDKKRLEARKLERKARNTPPIKVLELTVAQPVPHPIPVKEKVEVEKKDSSDETEDPSLSTDDPNVDPAMNETYQILLDYISIKNGVKPPAGSQPLAAVPVK